MAGPLARSYGAATMAGKDERNGRINPALECDDDLPVAEAKRLNQETAQAQVKKMITSATAPDVDGKSFNKPNNSGGSISSQGMSQDNTAFWKASLRQE